MVDPTAVPSPDQTPTWIGIGIATAALVVTMLAWLFPRVPQGRASVGHEGKTPNGTVMPATAGPAVWGTSVIWLVLMLASYAAAVLVGYVVVGPWGWVVSTLCMGGVLVVAVRALHAARLLQSTLRTVDEDLRATESRLRALDAPWTPANLHFDLYVQPPEYVGERDAENPKLTVKGGGVVELTFALTVVDTGRHATKLLRLQFLSWDVEGLGGAVLFKQKPERSFDLLIEGGRSAATEMFYVDLPDVGTALDGKDVVALGLKLNIGACPASDPRATEPREIRVGGLVRVVRPGSAPLSLALPKGTVLPPAAPASPQHGTPVVTRSGVVVGTIAAPAPPSAPPSTGLRPNKLLQGLAAMSRGEKPGGSDAGGTPAAR